MADLPGGLIWKLFEYLYSKRHFKWDKLAAHHASSESVRTAFNHISCLYRDLDVLVGPDGAFPIAVFELDETTSTNIEALAIDLQSPPQDHVYQGKFLDAVKRKKVDLRNGDTFCLSSVKFSASGKVTGVAGYLGKYFDMIATAEFLEKELLRAATYIGPFENADLAGRLTILSRYGSPKECLLNGGGVSAAIGISTLVVYKRDGEYWLLCEVRSARVAEYDDLYHVAPSFIYQPICALNEHNLEVERGIIHNIEREYLEELFGEKEKLNAVDPTYFYDHPNLAFLRQLVSAGKATHVPVALVFNLLNHRPELCTLLIVHDETWFRLQARAAAEGLGSASLKTLALNDEFEGGLTSKATRLKRITTRTIGHEDWGEVARPWNMVPPGAPALIMGVKKASSILGIDEPKWARDIQIQRSE